MPLPNNFSRSRRILEGSAKAEAFLSKVKSRKADWKDPEDLAAYRRNIRLRSRLVLVLKRAPDFKCPACRKVFVESKDWILFRSYCLCRTCYSKRKEKPVSVTPEFNPASVILFPPELRVQVNAEMLYLLRERAGLSKQEFADQCAWSRPYQQKLESGQIKTVEMAVARKILKVLSKNGVVTADSFCP